MLYFHSQRGISMVEVLVTLFISSVAITGLAGLQIQAIKATNDASQSSIAMWVVQDLVERIKSNTDGAYDGSYNAHLRVTQNCGMQPAKYCNPYFSQNSQDGDSCDAKERAAFDTWDVLCGASSSADITAHQAAALVNPQLIVQCSPPCSHYSITLVWQQQDTKSQDNQLSFDLDI